MKDIIERIRESDRSTAANMLGAILTVVVGLGLLALGLGIPPGVVGEAIQTTIGSLSPNLQFALGTGYPDAVGAIAGLALWAGGNPWEAVGAAVGGIFVLALGNKRVRGGSS
jgi:hypothetical protein